MKVKMIVNLIDDILEIDDEELKGLNEKEKHARISEIVYEVIRDIIRNDDGISWEEV